MKKIYPQRLEKKGAFLEHLGLAGLGHVMQNLFTHGSLKFGGPIGTHKNIIRNFVNGNDYTDTGRSAWTGLQSFISPEARVVDLESRHYGNDFMQMLTKHLGYDPRTIIKDKDLRLKALGLKPEDLVYNSAASNDRIAEVAGNVAKAELDPKKLMETKRLIVTLRRFLRGDFHSIQKNPRALRQVLETLKALQNNAGGTIEPLLKLRNLEKVVPEGKALDQLQPAEIASMILNGIRKNPEYTKMLEEAWTTNPFIGNLGRGVAKEMNAKTLENIARERLTSTPEKVKRSNIASNVSEGAANAGMLLAEPLYSVFNAKKRGLTSKWMQEFDPNNAAAYEGKPVRQWLATNFPGKSLRWVADWLKDFTTDKPIKNAFFNGIRAGDKAGYGPFNGALYNPDGNILQRIGAVAHRYSGNMPLDSITLFSRDLGKIVNKMNLDTIKSPAPIRFTNDQEYRKQVFDALGAIPEAIEKSRASGVTSKVGPALEKVLLENKEQASNAVGNWVDLNKLNEVAKMVDKEHPYLYRVAREQAEKNKHVSGAILRKGEPFNRKPVVLKGNDRSASWHNNKKQELESYGDFLED